MITKFISGGQTGVDRGALLAGLDLGIEIGGTCPKGRRAEDGRIPDMFPLAESPLWSYPSRTIDNIENSHATAILVRTVEDVDSGTKLTLKTCRLSQVLYAVIEMSVDVDFFSFNSFYESIIGVDGDKVVNFAGPRESRCGGIQEQTREFLVRAVTQYRERL